MGSPNRKPADGDASLRSARRTPAGRRSDLNTEEAVVKPKRSRAKTLAETALVAALYIVLVQALGSISFLVINVRVANALIGLVPIGGLPVVYGLTLGVFLGNLNSPVGAIDWLSFLPSLVGLLAVYMLRRRSVVLGLSLYTLILSTWLSVILSPVSNLPIQVTFVYVILGMTVSTVIMGYALYLGMQSTA